MSPPYGGMSSLSMSAVEKAPPSTTSTSSPIPPTRNNDDQSMIAKRVSATPASLDRCGERLRSGKLVSFPTETVYGLGCHALDPEAVRRVFDAKERPLSDPLIVHVTRSEDALALWEASSPADDGNHCADGGMQRKRRRAERMALAALARRFFPGPLTVVARARPSVPPILMAGTGYVACRSPSHPVARALIDAAGVPIAAPSANKFGHVSPTAAAHVMDDLGAEDVWVVDPGAVDDDVDGGIAPARDDADVVCRVGVESTVAKIEMNAAAGEDNDAPSSVSQVLGNITILRHGAVSSRSIRDALERENLSRYFIVSDSIKFTSEEARNVAPGQTVRHYSPNVPCFMIGPSRQKMRSEEGRNGDDGGLPDEEEHAVLSRSVIVDYGARLSHHRRSALAYRDLSPEGDPSVAASCLFETLRWSETVEGATRVFVPELVLETSGGAAEDGPDDNREGAALVLAVKDKLTRAASAVVVNVFR